MEDDARPVLGENFAHPLLFPAIREHGHRGADVAILLELAQDFEQVVLGVVDEHERSRRHARDLAAQLGADRAARSGDHHDLAREVCAHPLDLHPHGLAPEHVLDAHLAQLARDVQLP